ncbi:MAG: hypothetical protein GY925_25185, partial [Actinomycetia bacterium]|nr:hypothetical protein [Actinomycetes bacterium]
MASTAANLVDHVLPNQPMRQYVFTFPQPLPRLLAWRPELLERVLADIAHVVQIDLRRRTREPEGRAGLVSFLQNFTGDLRCFLHVHSLVPDGVFVEDDGGEVHFVRAPILTQADLQRVVEELARRVARTVQRWHRKLGDKAHLGEDLLDELGRLGEEQIGATAGHRRDRPAARQRRWLAEHHGFTIHAGVTANRGDARGRERLVRYMARPALALRRLSWEDGQVRIDFKQPWRNGVSTIPLPPETFVLRLASLVMPAGVNLVRY